MRLYTNIKQMRVYLVVLLFALFCILPFLMVVSGSISSEESIRANGYTLFPGEISFNAYKILLNETASRWTDSQSLFKNLRLSLYYI